MANRMICYGYGITEGKISVIEKEAEVVRRIFREYRQGRQLQEIAEKLTEDRVEFYLGNYHWNKNKIFRIIENENYIGMNEYPEIIKEEEFQCVREEKSKRGNKKITLSAEVEYLKKIAVCGQCGKPVHRRTKWKTRERWYCPNRCERNLYIDDELVFGGILSAVRAVVENPNLLTECEKIPTYQPTQEIMRYTNEIVRMTNQPQPSFLSGKKVILECADLKFQACKEDKSEVYTEFVKEKTKEEWERRTVGIDFLSEAVSHIKIHKDGRVAVGFINGAEVLGKEVVRDNATEDSDKDRRESIIGQGERCKRHSAGGSVLPCIYGRRVNIGETIK